MLLPRTSDLVGEVTPSIVASWFASRASSVIEHGNATDATAYLRVACEYSPFMLPRAPLIDFPAFSIVYCVIRVGLFDFYTRYDP